MKIITCNFRGRKHSERNEPCEDSVFFLEGSDVTVVAVADGAGSKKYEHAKDGADAVTRAVCTFFEQKFDDFFDSSNELELRSVIQTICHKALKERAKELELESIETLASTLLAVAIKGNKFISVQIGDGLIGRNFHGELEPVNMPQNGEFASSTYFINSPDAFKMIQVRKMFLSGTSHIFLMTDGIADCVFNDFNGVFNKSLFSILEMADEVNGEAKVQKVIKENIVDADPKSDDCTMAVICFNEKKSLEYEIPMPETKAKQPDNIAEAQQSAPAQNVPVAPLYDAQPVQQPQAIQEDVENRPVYAQTPQVQPLTYSMLANEQAAQAEAMNEAQAEEPVEVKKPFPWKVLVIAIASLIVVAAIVVGVILLTTDKNDNDESDKEDSVSVSEDQEENQTTTATAPSDPSSTDTIETTTESPTNEYSTATSDKSTERFTVTASQPATPKPER